MARESGQAETQVIEPSSHLEQENGPFTKFETHAVSPRRRGLCETGVVTPRSVWRKEAVSGPFPMKREFQDTRARSSSAWLPKHSLKQESPTSSFALLLVLLDLLPAMATDLLCLSPTIRVSRHLYRARPQAVVEYKIRKMPVAIPDF